MSSIAEDIRKNMMLLLKNEEAKTDLEGLSMISRIGMKVVSSNSMELDADAVSASCTALIDLGVRLSDATNHGILKEIILHNKGGYSIVVAINEEYIIFCGLKTQYRIGYYLGYLRDLALKLNILLSGKEITLTSLALEEAKTQEVEIKKEEESEVSTPIKPSVEQDKAALDGLLNFLDDWDAEEKASMGVVEVFEDIEAGGNIVGIPQSISTRLPKSTGGVGIPKQAQPKTQFQVFDDEVPPIPLEDYTPMEIEEEGESAQNIPPQFSHAPGELPPLDELPTFDQLNVPDFESLATDSEYSTDFVLNEESTALDSALKELGWLEDE
ncbi:MAG: hypothetical protein ACFFBP_18030 [Promethearchaeota archaeon]